jgi:outer membrane protein assembly factor BamB
VHGDLLIHNVGGRRPPDDGACVVAFDKATGEEVWVHRDAWGASYASPVVAALHGRPVLLVFAGGESRPATGGLLALNPDTGDLYSRFPWRAGKYESVNASSPVALPGNRVLIGETYKIGSVMLAFDEEIKPNPVWESTQLKNHWVTPVTDGDTLFSFTGRNPPDAELAAFDLRDGRRLWNEAVLWQEQIGGRPQTMSFFRGSLLKVDGRYLGLGEFGTLAWLDLRRDGFDVTSRVQLFRAQETWALPVVHRGLLFISQNRKDAVSGAPSRLLCYDLRAD